MSLHDEILEQPAVAARFLASQHDAIEALAAALRDRADRIEHVVIAARGSSDHAAIYAQYVLGVRHGLTAGLATPSMVSLYGADPGLAHTLVVAISQSGASPDIVAVVEAARRQGAPTVALTNDITSPLAATADRAIDMAAGPERSIAATKTYTASLLAIAALSAALGDDGDRRALASMPDAIASMLGLEDSMAAIAEAHAHADRALVVARGYEYATAREWAIKIKELAHVFADPYSAADFQHGPVALVEPGVPVIVVVRSGPTAAGLVQLLGRLREDFDADVTVLSDVPEALAVASRPVPIPPVAAEWLAPIATVVAGQLHALHLTRARGLDPDAPRSISKVTRTR
jgi:glutamine---fructose-6-phosphate transaminase (isomerizing)